MMIMIRIDNKKYEYRNEFANEIQQCNTKYCHYDNHNHNDNN